MRGLYLTTGQFYTFHMSAAITHLEADEYEVTGELIGLQEFGTCTLLIVKGEESGRVIAINTRHVGLIEKPGDSDREIEAPEIHENEDGTRTLEIPIEGSEAQAIREKMIAEGKPIGDGSDGLDTPELRESFLEFARRYEDG